jgi:DNA-binding PadR family transcriptional regulator
MVHALFFGRHGRHRHGHGFGFGWQGFGARWGGRTRRGDMKYLVLETLTAGPRHGYEIILAIEQKRGFRPSPGSIYPTLQMLEDGGFVSSTEVEGKRVYTITASGRTLLANRSPELDDEDEDDADAMRDRLKESAVKLGAAVMSARGSDGATLERIREILDRARREIYTLLASDET